MKNSPKIRRMGDKVFHLDLRSNTFNDVRAVVADGKKILQFQTRKEAEEKAEAIERLIAEHGRKKIASVDFILKEDPRLLQEKLTPYNKTIRDAVEFYVQHLETEMEKQRSETFDKLLDEWIGQKEREVQENTLRPRTLLTLKSMSKKYKIQWGNKRVATISSGDIKTWLDNLTYRSKEDIENGMINVASQQTKYHHWSYLSQFFNWCRKTYRTPKENPCEFITVKREDNNPEFFTPKQVQEIIDLSLTERYIDLLPFHVICLFSGTRPTECERLTWDNIDFEDKSIIIEKKDAKTRKHRRIEMQPNLVEWLNWFHAKYPNKPLIQTVNFNDSSKRFRHKLGYWQANAMRHSFASYYLGGIKKDFGALELQMGNSRTMLQNHYVKFPNKADSELFWNIKPSITK